MRRSIHQCSRFVDMAAVLSVAVVLSACSTEPPTQFSAHMPPPSTSTLGPEFEVIKGSMDSYDVDGVADKVGHIHLIIGKRAEARHLVVELNGVGKDELIVGGETSYPASLEQEINFPGPLTKRVALVDIATDPAGNLHAIVNADHYARIKGKWVGRQPTPWQTGRVKPELDEFDHPFFVKNMPDLTWAFYVNGSDLSLGYGITWVSGGGFIAPAPVDLRRFVVVPEEHEYRRWFVLGAEGDRTSVALIGPDQQKMLSAVYTNTSNLAIPISALGYARFRPDAACPPVGNKAVADRIGLKNATDISVCPIQELPLVSNDSAHAAPAHNSSFYRISSALADLVDDPPSLDLADLVDEQPYTRYYGLDSQTGSLLIVDANGTGVLADTEGNATRLPEMPIKHAGIVFASTGNERFSVLATGMGVKKKGDQPVYYLEFKNNAWSAPVEIGTYAPTHPAGGIFKIIPDNHGHALLLWPHKDALVARWVTLR